jgi:hypothetical protein
MASFEHWAGDGTDVIEEKLGVKNVKVEIFEDHAIWTSRANRGVARPEDDGKRVTVVFDHGLGHQYLLADDAAGAGAEIVGRLLGI